MNVIFFIFANIQYSLFFFVNLMLYLSRGIGHVLALVLALELETIYTKRFQIRERFLAQNSL